MIGTGSLSSCQKQHCNLTTATSEAGEIVGTWWLPVDSGLLADGTNVKGHCLTLVGRARGGVCGTHTAALAQKLQPCRLACLSGCAGLDNSRMVPRHEEQQEGPLQIHMFHDQRTTCSIDETPREATSTSRYLHQQPSEVSRNERQEANMHAF